MIRLLDTRLTLAGLHAEVSAGGGRGRATTRPVALRGRRSAAVAARSQAEGRGGEQPPAPGRRAAAWGAWLEPDDTHAQSEQPNGSKRGGPWHISGRGPHSVHLYREVCMFVQRWRDECQKKKKKEPEKEGRSCNGCKQIGLGSTRVKSHACRRLTRYGQTNSFCRRRAAESGSEEHSRRGRATSRRLRGGGNQV